MAAVFGQAHHALFIDGVAVSRAVAPHGQQPFDLGERPIGADGQGRMLVEHPFDRLAWDTWRSPRAGITKGKLAGIGKTGFQSGPSHAVNDRDAVSLAGKIISAGYAFDAST